MPNFSYDLPNGATITVTAPNKEAAIPMLKSEYDRLTGDRSLLQKAGDSLAVFNQGATFGWQDEMQAGADAALARLKGEERPIGEIYRERLNQERNRVKSAQADSPVGAAVNEFTGNALTSIATGGAGPMITSLPRMAASGGLWGAASGAGQSETDAGTLAEQALQIGEDALKGGATGAVTSAALGRAMGVRGDPPIDSAKLASEKIREAKRTYQNLLDDNQPVPKFGSAVSDIVKAAEKKGIGKYGDPVIYQRLKRAEGLVKEAEKAGRSVTYREVDDVIEAFSNAAKSPNKTQRSAALWARDRLYEDLDGMGIERRAADASYRQGARSEAVTEAIDNARQAAARSGIGGNVINTQRQAISKLIRDNRKTGFFSPDEIAMMNKFVDGGGLDNLLRGLAGLSPTRSTIVPLLLATLGFQSAGSGAGMATSAGLAAAATAGAGVGGAAKMGAEKMARDQIMDLQRKILTGADPTQHPAQVVGAISKAGGVTGGAVSDNDLGYYPGSLLEYLK